MQFCPQCGAALNGASVCPSCGYNTANYEQPASFQAPAYKAPAEVTPYSTGGLLAWSIISLLLCTIPGIVAIVQTCKINKCTTREEQQSKIKSAKTWCIVGTVLGVLSVIVSLIGAMA